MDESVLANWVEPGRHAWVFHTEDDEDWHGLIASYGGRFMDDPDAPHKYNGPFIRILEIVKKHGCQTVVVENRYVDPDWRSEYNAFWAGRFAQTSPFARRLHFFAARVEDEQLHQLPREVLDAYLGYVVMRPAVHGPVGRTMVVPPIGHEDHVQTLVTEDVHLFGNALSITATPFMQQDTEFLACAQVSAWMVHYAAVLRGIIPRQLTAQFVALTPTTLSEERALPGHGMNLNQLQAVFHAVGVPALHYGLTKLPAVRGVHEPIQKTKLFDRTPRPEPGLWDDRIQSAVCRYLNSRHVVLAAMKEHAFVVVGYYRDKDDNIRFLGHDDQRGPYIALEYTTPWKSVMIPLPEKIYMSGEDAEDGTITVLEVNNNDEEEPPPPLLAEIEAAVLNRSSYATRVYLQSSNEYKRLVAARGLPDQVVRELRLARMSRFVWVGEIQKREETKGAPREVAVEVIFDATSQAKQPKVLATLLPMETHILPPDGGDTFTVPHPEGEKRWRSALPLPVGSTRVRSGG
jgi:hypothetical protein